MANDLTLEIEKIRRKKINLSMIGLKIPTVAKLVLCCCFFVVKVRGCCSVAFPLLVLYFESCTVATAANFEIDVKYSLKLQEN